MIFEINKPVAENEEEQELITKGKKDKAVRLYGTYIYKVLLEESDKEHPFTVKQLCKRILERFKVYIDITTIRDYLKDFNVFDDYELKGYPLDGYYLVPSPNNKNLFIKEENRLEDYQIHYLIEHFRYTRDLMIKEKTNMVKNLALMGSNPVVKDYLLTKPAISYNNEDKQEIYMFTRLLDDLPEIIQKQIPIEIKYKRADGKMSKYEKFYVYAAINFIGIYLVGTFPSVEDAYYIRSDKIIDYRILDGEHFEKTKPKIWKELFLDDGSYRIFKEEHANEFCFQE